MRIFAGNASNFSKIAKNVMTTFLRFVAAFSMPLLDGQSNNLSIFYWLWKSILLNKPILSWNHGHPSTCYLDNSSSDELISASLRYPLGFRLGSSSDISSCNSGAGLGSSGGDSIRRYGGLSNGISNLSNLLVSVLLKLGINPNSRSGLMRIEWRKDN